MQTLDGNETLESADTGQASQEDGCHSTRRDLGDEFVSVDMLTASGPDIDQLGSHLGA